MRKRHYLLEIVAGERIQCPSARPLLALVRFKSHHRIPCERKK